MTENEIVKGINHFFQTNNKKGIAYRRKQSTFSSQYCDILVDTAENQYKDLAIEHKSFKTSSTEKLYFSQHFSSHTKEDELQEGHQIQRLKEFQKRTGRKTYVVVEVRKGKGKPRQIYFVKFDLIHKAWKDYKQDVDNAKTGFSLEDLEKVGVKTRKKDGKYKIPETLLT